ncbi:hypothetical protein BDW68DRAFT_177408 [Aspergillus falconensis]
MLSRAWQLGPVTSFTLPVVRRPPFETDEKPGPLSLKGIEFLLRPPYGMLVLEEDVFGFLLLHSVRDVHVRGLIRPESVVPMPPPRANAVENIKFEAIWTGTPFEMPARIKACTDLGTSHTLIDILPKNLYSLAIPFTLSVQLDPVFTGLTELLSARNQCANLKRVTLAYQSEGAHTRAYTKHTEWMVRLKKEFAEAGLRLSMIALQVPGRIHSCHNRSTKSDMHGEEYGHEYDSDLDKPEFLYCSPGLEWAAHSHAHAGTRGPNDFDHAYVPTRAYFSGPGDGDSDLGGFDDHEEYCVVD